MSVESNFRLVCDVCGECQIQGGDRFGNEAVAILNAQADGWVVVKQKDPGAPYNARPIDAHVCRGCYLSANMDAKFLLGGENINPHLIEYQTLDMLRARIAKSR